MKKMEIPRIRTPEPQAFERTHIERIRTMAPECMVLLKNNGTLPLKDIGKIALFGNGARHTVKGGGGSGDVNVRHFSTVEEGLLSAGFIITSTEWLDGYDRVTASNKEAFFAALRCEADAAGVPPMLFALGKIAPEPEYDLPLVGDGDTAVYVLARNSGEGADRLAAPGDIELTASEIRDILTLNEKYKHFVLVLNVGGLVNLEPVSSVGTVLLMGQLGTPTGDALADVLTGKSYPSGKLAMTWASIADYASSANFGGINDTEYREGIYVGYRQFDSEGKKPTFAFGSGLSYTSFEVKSAELMHDNEQFLLPVTVKNIGDRRGREVVQLYLSAPEGRLDKPYQSLVAYKKTRELAAGENQTLTLSFSVDSMASYDEKEAAWVIEAGTYFLRVGTDSRNTVISGKIEVSGEIITERDKNVCACDVFRDEKYRTIPYTHEKSSCAAALTLTSADVQTRITSYSQAPTEISDFTSFLSDEELAQLCVGRHTDSDDLMEIIGNAAKAVAGAAGETTERLPGQPALVFADGPAGLRLCQKYTVRDGVASGGSSANDDALLIYTPEERAQMKSASSDADGAEEYFYQYCAAVPIGTCIAQSWNDELAFECGDIVGAEMERFGVHVWLAPAMNIQRNPLCGRNFEYYSEDPLISGNMAAAITMGVQKHPGRTVAVKHFACNNQETNRFFTNSILNERALREIYLKGFEICVKKAQPGFLMTSYNLLNGVHTCNRRDLLKDVLRNEWGFKGIAMTDWLVTGGMGECGEKWPCASAAGNIKAGNDLTMPGMPSDVIDILDALENPYHPYALTRAELALCAERILCQIASLTEKAGRHAT